MTIDRMLSGLSISASGMSAERTRMEVIANNMANAHTTRGPDGKAFRRQQVIFQTVMDQNNHNHGMGGVEAWAKTDGASDGVASKAKVTRRVKGRLVMVLRDSLPLRID